MIEAVTLCEQVAQIASAIEAAATAQRLLLPAADAVQLRTQVTNPNTWC